MAHLKHSGMPFQLLIKTNKAMREQTPMQVQRSENYRLVDFKLSLQKKGFTSSEAS
jgi:hypothetical protein